MRRVGHIESARNASGSLFVPSLGVSGFVFLGILVSWRGGYLESLELETYDWLIRLQPTTAILHPRVVIIAITEKDINELGRWPISDTTLATVLEQIAEYRPRAIGLDIYRDIPVPPGRARLDEVFERYPSIIATMKFAGGEKEGIPPPPVLHDSDRVGFNDILIDFDGIVRRGLLFLDDEKTSTYSFALRLALAYLQAEGITPGPDSVNPAYIQLGPTTIPPLEANDGGYVGADARGYQFLLDFHASPPEFPHYSLSALMSGEIDPNVVKDKIVMIGVTAESVKDVFYTPRSMTHLTDTYSSGIFLHSQIVGQLLRFALDGDKPVKTANEWIEGIWILVWSVMGGLVGWKGRSPAQFSLIATIGLALLGGTAYVSLQAGLWILVAASGLAWLCSAALLTAYKVKQERHQRAVLMNLFARHVSPEIAEEIWQHREEFFVEGRPQAKKLTATVMFTDVVGFTALSERLGPQALVDWLNEYFDQMAPLVADHRGVVNKFIGDAIMAVFGVPVARTKETEIGLDAINAVRCALSMEKKLAELNKRWTERELSPIGMRIGIYTGKMVAGSIGDSDRLEYTVYGDATNIASRLESYDKDKFSPDFYRRPCRILIGEATLRHLNNQFQIEREGDVTLRGKHEKITVYRVVG